MKCIFYEQQAELRISWSEFFFIGLAIIRSNYFEIIELLIEIKAHDLFLFTWTDRCTMEYFAVTYDRR